MVPSRTSTQCRERWVNVLDTNINRNKWEKEEDERLISICKRYEGEEEIMFLTELNSLMFLACCLFCGNELPFVCVCVCGLFAGIGCSKINGHLLVGILVIKLDPFSPATTFTYSLYMRKRV